jgi:hypothetical protein
MVMTLSSATVSALAWARRSYRRLRCLRNVPGWLAVTVSLALLPGLAFAYDWEVTAHVLRVEGSYVPAYVNFQVDQNAGTCLAGQWLEFAGNSTSGNLPANVQAVYAGLLMNLQTGAQIAVFGDNSGCTVDYIHFLSN